MNMKKNIFLFALVVFSCTATGDNKPPNDLIPPDQMSEDYDGHYFDEKHQT